MAAYGRRRQRRARSALFFEAFFVPNQVFKPDGTDNGLITGYYEPLLHGARKRGGALPDAAVPGAGRLADRSTWAASTRN